MGNLVVGTNTFGTLAEAETYFVLRFGASKLWNSTLNFAEKEAALATAYRQLNDCGIFSLPTEIDLFTTAIKEAQFEQALFVIQHQEDADARQGIMAQGVTSAQIVGESYDLEQAGKIAISPQAIKKLSTYFKAGDNLYIGDLTRDEDEDA